MACKPPSTPDLGAFVREQIVAQQDRPNPIGFSLPDGANCRAWLASDSESNRIIGDDRWWRLNATELCKRRPASAKVRAILRTNDDGTYYITIDYDGSHEVIERSEMPEEDVGAILAAWGYLGTFALSSESFSVVTYATNDGTIPIPEVEKPKPDPIKGFRVRLCIEAEKELQVLGYGWRIVTCQFHGDKVLLHHNANIATMKRTAFKELVAAMRAIRRKRPGLRLVVSNPTLFIARAEAA